MEARTAESDLLSFGGQYLGDRAFRAGQKQWTAISLGVYSMRMARVNITMPDDLHAEAKRAGLNISQVAQQAVAAELTRLAKVAELDAYLAELDAELGPISDRDRADAKAWADKVLGADRSRRSA